jgi:GTP-binding protein
VSDEIYPNIGSEEELPEGIDLPDDISELSDEQLNELLSSLGLGSLETVEEEIDDLNRPIVAVVGRPNVGKSTLVNRIIGRREAVVEDVPGVTRDRVRYEAHWNGKPFILLDTGGWEHDAKGLSAQVSAQAQYAMVNSDVVIFVVDATVGATDADEKVVKILRGAKVPVLLVANKVDDQRTEADAAMLWSLGLGQPFPVSALHGRGSGDLLDAVIEALPEHGSGVARERGPRRIALLGKPNVGKSSLLNALAGETRVVVDSVAGTTVDPVDELITLGGKEWLLVDTAGIRRKAKQASGHEYFATLRTQAALEKAEVAVVLVDASAPLTEQDTRIISMVVESGRALVIAFNKWDLVDEERRFYLDREINRDLVQVDWAPRINLSARTKWHVDRLVPALEKSLAGWTTRVPTGRLNAFLGEIVAAHPHPVRGGKQPRILFGTQASTAPPTFVLFTSGFLEAGYRRFIERRFREEFGFVGSPVVINLRIREKRGRR